MDTACMDIEYVPTQVANHMKVIYNQFLNLIKLPGTTVGS